jgi:hypothetical protein
VHGDASPQNLLIPVQSPQTFVVIDWGFNSPQSVGFDLGQLLLGLAHAGELGVGDLPAIHEAIVPAYCEGLARAGFTASRDEVLLGHVGSMMLRSGFTSLPFDRLGGPADPELRRLFGERVRLTRFLLDLTMSTLR